MSHDNLACSFLPQHQYFRAQQTDFGGPSQSVSGCEARPYMIKLAIPAFQSGKREGAPSPDVEIN